jgi:ligand-binding SRPBCC domain-containing protein
VHVNATVEECWKFFSSPSNLQKITPETMGFQITDFDSKPMYAGQIIQYKVTPLLGITISWMTEISFVKENSYFVDEQRFGPYGIITNIFLKRLRTVLKWDVVHYALPLGFFRKDNEHLVVKSKLEEIFYIEFLSERNF